MRHSDPNQTTRGRSPSRVVAVQCLAVLSIAHHLSGERGSRKELPVGASINHLEGCNAVHQIPSTMNLQLPVAESEQRLLQQRMPGASLGGHLRALSKSLAGPRPPWNGSTFCFLS